MSNFVGIDITGVEAIKARLAKLPREAQDAGVEEANEYIVNIMREYPPKPTAPFVWSSDKQRKCVMAKLRESGFPGRSQELRNGWKTVGQGYKQIVANEVPHSIFVQGENQIIGHETNKWQTAEMRLKEKGKTILQKFEAGIKKAIRKLRLN